MEADVVVIVDELSGDAFDLLHSYLCASGLKKIHAGNPYLCAIPARPLSLPVGNDYSLLITPKSIRLSTKSSFVISLFT